MNPWKVGAIAVLLLVLLVAAFAAGPVAVLVMVGPAAGEPAGVGPSVTVTDDAIYRLFNDLRSQYLDDRAESITWWLMAAAVSLAFVTAFVTALGIIIVIAGFVGYRWFRDILDDARRYTGEAQESANQAKTVVNEAQSAATDAVASATQASEIVEQMKQNKEQSEQILEDQRSMTAEDFARSGEQRSIENELGSVENTPLDRAIAEAFRLQRQGNVAAAIEKWLAIANILEGVDDERAARAWFSIGYLHSQASEHETAIPAYDIAIQINPKLAEAYNNRAMQKWNWACTKRP